MAPPEKNYRRPPRRGAIVPLVALLLPAMLILLGFAVDVAHMQNTRSELRLATDNAARAAAGTFARTGSPTAARRAAKQIAEANAVAGSPLRLRNRDIQFGRSTIDGSGRYLFASGLTPFNAIRVNGSRTADSLSGAAPLYFGSLVGRSGFEPVTTAVASFEQVDICLVLDRSSSMKKSTDESGGNIETDDPRYCSPAYADSRWTALDHAVRVFIDVARRSASHEQVGLVTYASDIAGSRWTNDCGDSSYRTTDAASIELDLTDDLGRLAQEMDLWSRSNFNGATYIEAGMRRGLDVLTGPNSRGPAAKVMIVMTDGRQNIGDARDAARDCAAAGVTCHTITYSDHADLAVMGEVARTTGGRHLHTASPQQLDDAFRELVSGAILLTE